MHEMDQLLRGLGITEWRQQVQPAQHAEELERAYGDLTVDYRYFLVHYGSSTFKSIVSFNPLEKVPVAGGDGRLNVGLFYGFSDDDNDIRNQIRRYQDRLPDGFLPIADAPFGDQIFIALSGERKGKIYFWDHEAATDPGVFLVADSFMSFLESFQIEPEPD